MLQTASALGFCGPALDFSEAQQRLRNLLWRARSKGLPVESAVVGAPGALSIPDGSTVEVDPLLGTVRVV